MNILYLHYLTTQYVYLQANTFSSYVLAKYEEEQQVLLTSKIIRKPQLAAALRLCGLAPSKMVIAKLRAVAASLRRIDLPTNPAEVQRKLEILNIDTNGK